MDTHNFILNKETLASVNESDIQLWQIEANLPGKKNVD